MTRINVVHPRMLSDKHLGAEYRELPRVFGLVRRAQERGETPVATDRYILGPGHVRFFYTRLGFILDRYQALCHECRARGRKVSFSYPGDLVVGIHPGWFGDWEPTPEAVELNIKRINERGGLK
jgi:hypothetical protein